MLTLAPVPAADTASPQLDLFRLGGSVFLLCWTLDRPAYAARAITLTGQGRRIACASVTLALSDGRERRAIAFRYSGADGIVATLAEPGSTDAVTARFDPALVRDMADAKDVLSELAPKARLVLATALVGPWPTLFGLGQNATYLAFLRQFLLAVAPKPSPAVPVARLVEGKILVETVLKSPQAALKTVYSLDGAGLVRATCRPRLAQPDRNGRQLAHLILDDAPARSARLVVLQSESGLLVRAVTPRPAPPSLARWWGGKSGMRDGLRSWLVEQLTQLSEQGRLLAIEMQRRLPLAAQSVRRHDDLPSAELDLAVCTQAGLLIGGWFGDADGVVDQVLLHRGEGAPVPIGSRLERFPALLAMAAGQEKRSVTGFAARIPDYAAGAPVLQPRCELRLKSGTSLFLRPDVQPADPATIRARALAAIPPQHLTAAMLERTLAPVLADCQAKLAADMPEPSLRDFGKTPPRPTVSVVIPLYRVYEFLRIQVAAFAGDAWFAAQAELIYVLDSPEHAAEVAHLLGGLHLAYGLPFRLAVMARNGGFSAACNAGAALARGEALALVNSDVVPAGEGWLQPLLRRLDRRNRIGAVGPKLLYDDGSLQHAGLFFQRDGKGIWLNHHFFKGMPSSYGPANVERQVPGVTGACIVLPRALFREVGGFDGGYVIGDYEDSDLCLKIRRAGQAIVYVPEVALYHLERQSIAKSADYTRGIASQHNAWLQTQRWDEAIARLMAAIDRQEPRPEPIPVVPDFLPRANFREASAA